LAEAIEETVGLAVQIKWPNDLHVKGRKLSGILIETGSDRSGGYFAIVGVGINVNHEPEDFPEELREQATSLNIESRRPVDRAELAASILRKLQDWTGYLETDFPQVIAAARSRSSLLNRFVTIQCADQRIEGRAIDLDSDGRLLVELPDGSIQTFAAGEASILRR
jgi:BirA family biotin operon repressor/biotin-[acetyl-CoA-carboxylase] ligase